MSNVFAEYSMTSNVVFVQKNPICHGCLSSDRILQPLEQYSALYSQLLGDLEIYNNSDTQLCWECIALLRRTQKFQANIVSAQYLLQQWNLFHDNINKSLSPLSSLSKTENAVNYEFVYEELENAKPQIPFPIDPTVSTPPIKEEEDLKLDMIKEEYVDFDFDSYEMGDFGIDVKKEDRKPPRVKKKAKGHVLASFNYRKHSKIIAFDLDVGNLEQYYVDELVDSGTWDEKCRKVKKSSGKQYWCGLCECGFRNLLEWNRHQDYLHIEGSGPYKCSECKTKCTTKQLLSEHWMFHNRMYSCKLCPKYYTREWSIRTHFMESHRKQYVCRTCGKVLSTCTEFKAHYMELHKQYICDICGVKKLMKSMIERHMRMKHLPHVCKLCPYKFNSHATYTNHMRIYHPQLILKSKVNLELAYCVECNRQFPSETAYKKHLHDSVAHASKIRKENVPCPECGKIFARKVYMNNHFNFYHLKKTKHHCALCDKFFCNGYGLRKHKRTIHDKVPDPKNKICDMCGKGFASNRVLINHRRTHTGERPHACEHCSAAFAQKTALVSHVRTQHKHVL